VNDPLVGSGLLWIIRCGRGGGKKVLGWTFAGKGDMGSEWFKIRLISRNQTHKMAVISVLAVSSIIAAKTGIQGPEEEARFPPARE